MFTKNYQYSTHFPIVNAYHASMHYPTRIKLFMNNMMSAPKTIGVDGVMSYGGGTGMGLNLPRKAFGEYFERNHFFTAVPIVKHAPISALSSKQYQEKLHRCIVQVKFSKEDIHQHSFDWAPVSRLRDNSPDIYLFNAVSLNGKKEDGPFYNFNDSCSCAVHTTKQDALNNSIKEFIERQALVGSWLTQKYRYSINPYALKELTPYAQLIDNLLDNGELYIFDNGLNLPGYSTIIFYFAKSQDDLVQYSVGSSAGFSLAESLQGSFEELWQCYLFQYNAENSKGLEDRSGTGYHLSFQKCNHAGIRDIIPFVNDDKCQHYELNAANEILNQPVFTFDDVKAGLSQISSEIFYYHHFDKAMNMHFVKILSPDFFVHMALEQPLNIDNGYAESIQLARASAYLEKIPFP